MVAVGVFDGPTDRETVVEPLLVFETEDDAEIVRVNMFVFVGFIEKVDVVVVIIVRVIKALLLFVGVCVCVLDGSDEYD